MKGGEFFALLVCMLCGVSGGNFYDGASQLGRRLGGGAAAFFCDVAFFAVLSLLYLLFSLHFSLPAFRLYHLPGCLAGLFLYRKSIHEIIAFFGKIVYNKGKKIAGRLRPARRKGRKSCPISKRERKKS